MNLHASLLRRRILPLLLSLSVIWLLTGCSQPEEDYTTYFQVESELESSTPFGRGASYATIDGENYEIKEYSYDELIQQQATLSDPPVVQLKDSQLDHSRMASYHESNVELRCYPSSKSITAADLPQQDEWISLPGGNCWIQVPYSQGIAGELPRYYEVVIGTDYRTYDLQNIYFREGHPVLKDQS